MSTFAAPRVGAKLTCTTAPGVVFPDRAALLAHYKTDWHRYNLKRKSAHMAPIRKEMYERLMAAVAARQQYAEGTAEETAGSHIKADNRDKVAAKRAAKERKRAASEDGEALSPEEVFARRTKEAPAFNPCASLFEPARVAPDLESNLEHMLKHNGFFIPDVDYLKDLKGLLEYLFFKINVAHHCLNCDRMFQTTEACIQHMVDKFHCKIRHEYEEDAEELEEYYDYSSTWAEAGSEEEEGVEPSESRAKPKSTMQILESGELLLMDESGKTILSRRVGVRQFRRYYKQRYRPEEARESVLANSKERLLLCYKQAGVDNSTALSVFRMQNRCPLTKTEKRAQKMQRRAQQKWSYNMGMSQNLLTKNRVAGKNMGAGWGVHG